MSTLHLRIVGRVQGVGFREATRQQALRIGITGWVRNRLDGTVEAVIAGDEATVLSMFDWCRTGPPLARVDQIEQSVTSGNFNEFVILPTE